MGIEREKEKENEKERERDACMCTHAHTHMHMCIYIHALRVSDTGHTHTQVLQQAHNTYTHTHMHTHTHTTHSPARNSHNKRAVGYTACGGDGHADWYHHLPETICCTLATFKKRENSNSNYRSSFKFACLSGA